VHFLEEAGEVGLACCVPAPARFAPEIYYPRTNGPTTFEITRCTSSLVVSPSPDFSLLPQRIEMMGCMIITMLDEVWKKNAEGNWKICVQ